MDFINARSCRLQLLEDFRRKKIPQTTFVFQPPEPEYFFNKTLDQVAAFHMTLLAEKMDQGVPDAGAPQLQVDDQGRKEGAAPFGVASDKVQPDPHIDQVAGVADQLPIGIDSFHPRVLKTEMEDLF